MLGLGTRTYIRPSLLKSPVTTALAARLTRVSDAVTEFSATKVLDAQKLLIQTVPVGSTMSG